jgi:hypothetical protein
MPAITVASPSLQRRDLSQGQTFAVIFAVIAFIAIAISLILVLAFRRSKPLPTHVPLSRYPVAPNYPQPFNAPPRFPSHPALLRHSRRTHDPAVRTYDPRVESPFPNTPPHISYGYDQIAPGNIAPNSGLFTPPQRSVTPGLYQQDQQQRVIRTSRSDPRTYITFNTKHDYILPVPEPIALKPRPAGRPPPLTRQLEKFPMPLSSSKRGEELHPIKLFQEIEQRSSSATANTFGIPCPAPSSAKKHAPVEMKLMSKRIGEPLTLSQSCESIEDPQGLTSSNVMLPFDAALLSCHPSSVDERLTMKKGIFNKGNGLERMGTLTRPKTPVSERRDWFDRAASNACKAQVSLQTAHTPSSNPFTTPGFVSTAPTSPEILANLPAPKTPTRPEKGKERLVSPIRRHRRTPSSVALPSPTQFGLTPTSADRRVREVQKLAPEENMVRKWPVTKPRLKLVPWSKLRPHASLSRRYSGSSLSTIFKPVSCRSCLPYHSLVTRLSRC